MKEILVKDVMKKKVVTVKRFTTLKELIEIFRKHTFHTIPVIEDDKITGIVELKHFLRVFQFQPIHVQEILRKIPFLEEEEENFFDLEITPEMIRLCIVDDIMESKFLTIGEDATIQEAQRLMNLHQTQRLVVVNKKDNLTGIIGLFDIALAILKEKGIV